MISKTFKKAEEIILKHLKLGFKELDNGTKLIGHIPQLAEMAYLHIIFAPLSNKDIIKLEKSLNTDIPDIYKEFLCLTNGLSVFSESLTLDGYRKDYSRIGDDMWQPFDLDIPNVAERLPDAEPSFFFIGGYGYDGSLLYIDKKTNIVYRCLDYASNQLNKWDDFENILISEMQRLETHFDEKGNKIDESRSTTPWFYSFYEVK